MQSPLIPPYPANGPSWKRRARQPQIWFYCMFFCTIVSKICSSTSKSHSKAHSEDGMGDPPHLFRLHRKSRFSHSSRLVTPTSPQPRAVTVLYLLCSEPGNGTLWCYQGHDFCFGQTPQCLQAPLGSVQPRPLQPWGSSLTSRRARPGLEQLLFSSQRQELFWVG